VAPAWVVVAAAVDLGEAKDVVEARKRHVDVVARDLAGIVVNVRAAGTQTPTSGQFSPWEQCSVDNHRRLGAYPYLGSNRSGRTGIPNAPPGGHHLRGGLLASVGEHCALRLAMLAPLVVTFFFFFPVLTRVVALMVPSIHPDQCVRVRAALSVSVNFLGRSMFFGPKPRE